MNWKLPLSHIWIPAPNPSPHLMVVLHGLGDSPQGFLWMPDAFGFASLNYLLLTAPDAYYSGFSWYDIGADSLRGITRSRQLLAEVFAETSRQGFAPDHTFLFGFSQGCLMTLEFGARHTQPLAGYIGISGYSIDPEALLAELNPEVNRGNWLITHGRQDDLLPVQNTRAQMKLLQDGGFRIEYREYVKAHTMDPQRELPDILQWLGSRISA